MGLKVKGHMRTSHFPLNLVGRDLNPKGASGEVSERYEEHVTGQWRKDDPCHKVERT